MPRTHSTVNWLCLAVLFASTLAACGSALTPAVPPRPGMTLNLTSGPCPSAVVKSGDAVTWTVSDAGDRQIRGVRDAIVMFDSGILKPGDSFTFVYVDEGQFPYTCSIDGSLTGTITVEP